eukprot:364947-Chlamydomonas_euryale.AAC.6
MDRRECGVARRVRRCTLQGIRRRAGDICREGAQQGQADSCAGVGRGRVWQCQLRAHTQTSD